MRSLLVRWCSRDLSDTYNICQGGQYVCCVVAGGGCEGCRQKQLRASDVGSVWRCCRLTAFSADHAPDGVNHSASQGEGCACVCARLPPGRGWGGGRSSAGAVLCPVGGGWRPPRLPTHVWHCLWLPADCADDTGHVGHLKFLMFLCSLTFFYFSKKHVSSILGC